ncbi:hypothetical protein C1I97_35465, partial [Streptomyces sp. NTH33]
MAEAETRILPAQAADPTGSAPDPSIHAEHADTEQSGPTGTGPLRVCVDDPWQSGETRGTHDPHEVTIQLDAVELGGSFAGAAATVGGKEADRPVFVDESGRRSRRFRRLGMAVGLACAVYAVVIVVTLLSGNAAAPWVPVPAPGADEQPASKVDESPRPAESAAPSASTDDLPGVTTDPTTPSTEATSSAGATAVPGATAEPGTAPTVSTQPQPSVSSTKRGVPDRVTVPSAPGGNGSPSVGNP